jgi:hypothetical protein
MHEGWVLSDDCFVIYRSALIEMWTVDVFVSRMDKTKIAVYRQIKWLTEKFKVLHDLISYRTCHTAGSRSKIPLTNRVDLEVFLYHVTIRRSSS